MYLMPLNYIHNGYNGRFCCVYFTAIKKKNPKSVSKKLLGKRIVMQFEGIAFIHIPAQFTY